MKDFQRLSVFGPHVKRHTVMLPPKKQESCDFKSFFKATINEQTIKRLKFNELNKSIEDLLIDELRKPAAQDALNYDMLKRRQSKDFKHKISISKRNVDVIIYLLEQIKPFYQFLRFNAIQYIELKKLAAHLQYQFYPKGSYIYQYRERSNKFFGIIKGLVSMNKRIVHTYPLNKNPSFSKDLTLNDSISESAFVSFLSDNNDAKTIIPPNELRSQFEIELSRYTPGMCFGEWNLIDNTTHSSSAYCIEDTHVFYLTKEHFDQILSDSISQASYNCKSFVYKCIPFLNEDDLNQIKPMFYTKGTMIYTQYTKAEEIFILYQGECILTHDSKAKCSEDILERRNKQKIISIINKGGIVGLEAANANSLYEDNLEVSKNYTVLYRFNVREIEKRANIIPYLLRMKEMKRELYESNRKVNQTLTGIGRSYNGLYTNLDQYNKDTALGEKVSKIMLNMRKRRHFNEFKPISTNINYSSLYRIKTEGNSIRQSINKTIGDKGLCNSSNNGLTTPPIIDRYSNKASIFRSGNPLSKLHLQTDENYSLTATGTNTGTVMSHWKFYTCISGNEITITKPRNMHRPNKSLFDYNTNYKMPNVKTSLSGYKNKKRKVIKDNDRDKEIDYNEEDDIDPNTVIKASLKLIKKDNKDRVIYNTGKFNLPLFSQIRCLSK